MHQKITRRDKKAFLSDQCKEIEENNRMERTRDLFTKTGDTKGTLQAKMVSIKDRNGMDLIEAEDIKKRYQAYTEELYKKDLHDPDKIMASGPITSWQIDGETVETVAEFIFGGSKITADDDCTHEIKRCLLLGRKVMTNLDSILKSRDICTWSITQL